jgi:hypothetical protein
MQVSRFVGAFVRAGGKPDPTLILNGFGVNIIFTFLLDT